MFQPFSIPGLSSNPERSQNRRFPKNSRIESQTGKLTTTQSHNLLLARLILSPPCRDLPDKQQIVALSWCELTCLRLNSRLFRKSAILTSLGSERSQPQGREAPGTFLRLFGISGSKGPNDSCQGPRKSQGKSRNYHIT